ncbi:cobaltochelatase CobT-related protein [Caulobacter sp. ErkDOM-E]|uniref:cobaltochelatase CobT-related protein n=1 Tax=Caulobacter sp. ErkDOM-E TaxID=3402778 RepID=UPI003AF90120
MFTRDFDKTVKSADLDSVLGPLSAVDAAANEEAWAAFSGRLQAWRTQLHLFALESAGRIRQTVSEELRTSTIVTILVDQSGSMRGQSMLLAAAATDVSKDFLGHLGFEVEILGFTTTTWRGGKSRQRWKRTGSPKRPGRLCDLLHVIYCSFEDKATSTMTYSLKSMLRPDLPKENVDGEALIWATSRLRARPASRRLILIVSDGAPVDDSTLAANEPDILDVHLRQVIADVEASGDIRLAAVGIGFDVRRYYAEAATVQAPDDLGQAMIMLLERLSTDATSPTA